MVEKSVPHDLLRSLQQVSGFDEEAFVKVHDNRTQVVSIRINPGKIHIDPLTYFPGSSKVPWSSTGYYLPSRPSFTLDPLLHAGAYYVQEASGMFIEQCLGQTTDLHRSLRVLDLCASPGGKSTLIHSFITDNSLLVSNEVIKTRVSTLVENISKWGALNVIVTNNDPRDFNRLKHYFDIMLVDAPCSGSGLFRRDPDAIDEWSADAVNACSMRQKRILTDAYECLKRDGILIYSTCSYSAEENEAIGDWLMSNFDVTPIRLQVDPAWNIVETVSELNQCFGYRFFPDKVMGEGFYTACFRKNDGSVETEAEDKRNRFTAISASEKKVIQPWLNEKPDENYYQSAEGLFAFPASLSNDLMMIHSSLYIKKAGVPLGKTVRDELVPAHELALSELAGKKLFTISLKKEEALQYLRKEEVTIRDDRRGWALVQYEGLNLGWVKMLGTRANNYYPKEWRILKSGKN